jgi:hypothetical protein
MSEEEAVLNEYTWALVIFFTKWIDTEILGFAMSFLSVKEIILGGIDLCFLFLHCLRNPEIFL